MSRLTGTRIPSALGGILISEMRTQLRSGLTALYIGMPFLWILIARLLPPDRRPIAVLIGTFSDPVMMGQIFAGAFLARERDQGLLEAWAVTPLGAGTWLAGRILLIGFQGSLGGLILAFGTGVPFRPALLIPGVFLASAVSALIGLILARPFRDILSYFVLGGISAALVNLPLAGILLVPSIPWLFTGPAVSGWVVISSSFGIPVTDVSEFAALGLLLVWTTLLFILGRYLFHSTFFRRRGLGDAP